VEISEVGCPGGARVNGVGNVGLCLLCKKVEFANDRAVRYIIWCYVGVRMKDTGIWSGLGISRAVRFRRCAG